MINLNIAEEYRVSTKQAKIFGFVLYTNSHSNIIETLSNNNHWNALDEDSNGWIIFSIKPQQGRMKMPEFPPGMVGLMIPVWEEPNANKSMLSVFGLQDTRHLPCFVAFSIDNDELKRVVYPLKDDTMDNARNSLKKVIKKITETVDEILPEYKNTDAVFREVEKTVESTITWEKVVKGVQIINWLKGLIK